MVYMLLVLIVVFNIVLSNSSNCPNEQSIAESLEKVHIPGAVIIVVNATHTLYEQAFGHQSFSPLKAMDINKSIFPIASLSKTFIAVAVMQLVEEDLVDLDTDINQYLLDSHKRIFHPDYPTHSITLRKLLSHTASIAVSPQVQNTYYKLSDAAFEESLSDFCYKYVNPNTSYWLPKPPGSVTFYSNEGASLAALVVERVANMSYIQYVKERILKPLDIDINKTGIQLADFSNTEDFVKHYTYALNTSYLEGWNQEMPQLNITQIPGQLPTWLYIPYFGFSAYPAGLLRMSAGTLSIYLRMFLNNGSSILRPRSIAEIRTVVGGGLIPSYNQDVSNNSTERLPPSQFGLSWYWETMSNDRRYIGHSGSMPGMVHLMLVNEKNSVGVIVLSNGDISAPTDLSKEIFKTIANIHMSLFQCFERDISNASACHTKGTHFRLFLAILLCFAF